MLFFSLVVVLGILAALGLDLDIVPAAKIPASPYHRWAHEHWVWIHHGDQMNQTNCEGLIKDYTSRGIKVGGFNIDSEWATQFNNFEVNVEKFPDFQGMVGWIHDQGVHVILWVTSFVNEENPDFQMAVDNKYLIRDKWGKVRPMKWWHGKGGLLDYSNPDARAWWHSKMDNVLKLPNGDGVDGFKCDASDPYIEEYIQAGEALGYNDVPYTGYHQYADYYYGDFFNHTRAVRGEQGLVMSRPVDCLEDVTTQVCMAQSPKYVMTSGWVGDDDATFQGLRGCARKVIYSAWDGYANFGCDVAGYRDPNPPLEDKMHAEFYLRSAQFNAFLPLMENGGGGEHRPWMVVPSMADQITDIYKKYANEHTRLSPYMLTTGSIAIQSGTSSITPLAINKEDKKRHRSHRYYSHPSTYSYLLGQDVLIHPELYGVTEKELDIDVGFVDMQFPGDESTQWLSWWHPHLTKLAHMGGTEAKRAVALDEWAVYVRRGAILPLLEESGIKKYEDGATNYNTHIVFTWFAPAQGDATARSEMREPLEAGPGMVCLGTVDATTGDLKMSISAHDGPVGVSIVGIDNPNKVSVKGSPCLKHVYDPLKHTLLLKCEHNKLGAIVDVKF